MLMRRIQPVPDGCICWRVAAARENVKLQVQHGFFKVVSGKLRWAYDAACIRESCYVSAPESSPVTSALDQTLEAIYTLPSRISSAQSLSKFADAPDCHGLAVWASVVSFQCLEFEFRC